MKIRSIDAYPIFDSRGNPTVEVALALNDGAIGRGLVPSGASTGQFEALELRDRDPKRFRGKGVDKAVANANGEIARAVSGVDWADQASLDRRLIELDGTPNKSRLGANAILGVSMAFASAMAASRGVPLFRQLGDGTTLPLPQIQLIGGGAHAEWRTDVQDFLIIAVGANDYAQTLQMTFDVYHAAGELLARDGKRVGVADEGGYWPVFDTNEAVLAFVVRAIEHAGYRPGADIAIALDVAASDLYDAASERYRFKLEDRTFTRDQFAALMAAWCDRYPIVSIEDPMADEDEAGWSLASAALRSRVQLIGDDLFVTNLGRIRAGIASGQANAVLIKLNQVGTVTETIDAIRLTQSAGMAPVVSARSGETEDAFIAHLAIATNAGQLKVGSFSRTERMVKWNEVLRISRQLGAASRFPAGLLRHGPTA